MWAIAVVVFSCFLGDDPETWAELSPWSTLSSIFQVYLGLLPSLVPEENICGWVAQVVGPDAHLVKSLANPGMHGKWPLNWFCAYWEVMTVLNALLIIMISVGFLVVWCFLEDPCCQLLITHTHTHTSLTQFSMWSLVNPPYHEGWLIWKFMCGWMPAVVVQ